MIENKFRVWCEFEVRGKIETSMEEPCSWFLMTQTGELWSYGPMTPPRPLREEYKKAIPLFYIGYKDKTGQEIYEGDIVENFYREKTICGSRPMTEKIIISIPEIYKNTNIYIKDSIWVYGKVIGNIYVNPELKED